MNANRTLGQLNLLGSSPRFTQSCALIHKFSRVDATVLIEGETGTGKEVAARALHYLGKRSGQAFIPVNCGGLPETLIESELFGHERGAFTDAKSASAGLVSEADGGTLFLDEVDSLSMKAQAALLRFLQDKTYRRVGSGVTRQADVRIVVASNASLEKLVEAGQFRRDLLYRLNVLVLRMPPLRERQDDALELAQIFAERFSDQYRMARKSLHPNFIAMIGQHDWPGNVRELENAVHRQFLLCEDGETQLGAALAAAPALPLLPDFKSAKAHAISEFERRYVQDTLKQSAGNLSQAARLAGQERSAFGKLARKYGMSERSLDGAIQAESQPSGI